MSGFDLAQFLGGLNPTVPPSTLRPLVVRAAELQPIPAGTVPNPTSLSIVGNLPTVTFELFRQEIPPGQSSDMHRHHHETVHVVLAGQGHSEIEDESVAWSAGDYVYTPPWTWHRHYNDSGTDAVQLLTVESSRLLGALGVNRRQSAGLVTVAQARLMFPDDGTRGGGDHD